MILSLGGFLFFMVIIVISSNLWHMSDLVFSSVIRKINKNVQFTSKLWNDKVLAKIARNSATNFGQNDCCVSQTLGERKNLFCIIRV